LTKLIKLIVSLFWMNTALASIEQSNQHSALASIENYAQKFKMFQAVMQNVQFKSASREKLKNTHALFLPFKNLIYVNEGLKNQIFEQQVAVLAHEIGHAFAYQALAPLELAFVAHEFGPWSAPSDTQKLNGK
jgi:hypothetical protein